MRRQTRSAQQKSLARSKAYSLHSANLSQTVRSSRLTVRSQRCFGLRMVKQMAWSPYGLDLCAKLYTVRQTVHLLGKRIHIAGVWAASSLRRLPNGRLFVKRMIFLSIHCLIDLSKADVTGQNLHPSGNMSWSPMTFPASTIVSLTGVCYACTGTGAGTVCCGWSKADRFSERGKTTKLNNVCSSYVDSMLHICNTVLHVITFYLQP